MHILHTVLYTFCKVLIRIIFLGIKGFFSWCSFPLLSRPKYMGFSGDILRRNWMQGTSRDQWIGFFHQEKATFPHSEEKSA